ncbi:MAG: hypothetical protein ABH885_05645, partial [Candidatus Omnitrophota bacterium]
MRIYKKTVAVILIFAFICTQNAFTYDAQRACLAPPDSFSPAVTITIDQDGNPQIDTASLYSRMGQKAPEMFLCRIIAAALAKRMENDKVRLLTQQVLAQFPALSYDSSSLSLSEGPRCELYSRDRTERLSVSLSGEGAPAFEFNEDGQVYTAWVVKSPVSSDRPAVTPESLAAADGALLYDGDAYTRFHRDFKDVQMRAQAEEESKVIRLHRALKISADRGG